MSAKLDETRKARAATQFLLEVAEGRESHPNYIDIALSIHPPSLSSINHSVTDKYEKGLLYYVVPPDRPGHPPPVCAAICSRGSLRGGGGGREWSNFVVASIAPDCVVSIAVALWRRKGAVKKQFRARDSARAGRGGGDGGGTTPRGLLNAPYPSPFGQGNHCSYSIPTAPWSVYPRPGVNFLVKSKQSK